MRRILKASSVDKGIDSNVKGTRWKVLTTSLTTHPLPVRPRLSEGGRSSNVVDHSPAAGRGQAGPE